MVKLTLTNKNSTPTTKGVARRVPPATNSAPKGVAKKVTPSSSSVPKGIAKKITSRRTARSRNKKVDGFLNRGVYMPPARNFSGRPPFYEAGRSFNATSAGDVYRSEAGLDVNGQIEFRTGNTPSGLFSPAEGERWDIPYTPDHISQANPDLRSTETSPDRDIVTPESRDLLGLFTPDAPRGPISKKVVTEFVSDYGDNVPDSAQGENYTGPKIIAVVVKTFTPSYIVQMPKNVRALIYSFTLFPYGKAKAPRPYFSHLSTFHIRIPPLLQVCKQLRNEASWAYYGSFLVTGSSVPSLVPWLHTLSPSTRPKIGKIMIPFDPWNHVDKTKKQQMILRLKEFRAVGIEVKRPRFDLLVKPQDKVRSLGGDLTDEE